MASIARCDRAYCGLDFGFAVDPDAFVKLSYDGRLSRLTFLDEFCEVRAPIDRLADEVLKRLDAGEHVICDSADPRMIDELRRRGVRALAARLADEASGFGGGDYELLGWMDETPDEHADGLAALDGEADALADRTIVQLLRDARPAGEAPLGAAALGERKGQVGLHGRRMLIEIVAVERQARLQPERIAGAEPDRAVQLEE